jgi:hypothetical protein
MIEILLTIYLAGVVFLLGFGIADQIAFSSPDYRLVVFAAVLWPLLVIYAIGERLT